MIMTMTAITSGAAGVPSAQALRQQEEMKRRAAEQRQKMEEQTRKNMEEQKRPYLVMLPSGNLT